MKQFQRIARLGLVALVALAGARRAGAAAPDIRIEPLTLNFSRPVTRDIYVEIDWMEDSFHSHKPSTAVINRIVQSFAAAGYAIHIDVSNAVPHQSTLAVTNAPSSSASVQSIMSQNFNHAGDSRYYYSLWGHNYSFNGTFTTSSGIADLPGRVHLVTLGSFSGQTGTFSNQVGTFVHEFGHNLGQRHGGADHENYKPNYLSVMNYFYQLDGLGPSLVALTFANTVSGFDDFSYSHGLSPSLDETNLDEGFGIGLGKAIDWNCNGSIQSGVAKDIQNGNWCTAAGGLSVISDFDNWTSLGSQIRTAASRTTAADFAVPCITAEEHEPIARRIQELRDQGLLPPDGPGDEVPVRSAAGHSFFVFNDGNAALNVTGMSLDVATSWIRWEPKAPFTVQPGKSQEVLVYVDLSQVPAGQTTRRLVVQSNDPDENPYPGGVNLVISGQAASPSILLVDDDDNAPDVLSSYEAALDALGKPYLVWDTLNSDVEPGSSYLGSFKTVIWFSGGEFGGFAGPGFAGEADLASFLDGGAGRCLLMSSQDYLFDHGLTGFMSSYLGVASGASDVAQTSVTGQGSAFTTMGPYALSYPFENFSDRLSPAAGAELAFSGSAGDAAVSRIGPNYRTIYLGFPLEALPTVQARRDVMAAALDYCAAVFADVPPRYWARRFIEGLFNAGVTGGCATNPRRYCPGDVVTRDQMAVFLLRSKEGASYAPPACTTQTFGDVPVSSPYCPWIQELARRGVTGGCGNGNYCPQGQVNRQQVAVFLLATLQGPGYSPPACTTQTFGDVPVSSPYCPWIQELAHRGVTGGCGNGNYCPADLVNRAQMSVFLVSTFNLPLP